MAAKPNVGKVLFVLVSIPISLTLIVMLQSGFLFVLLGLMPSMVAYYVDMAKGKPTFKCVLCCNFAGMVPTFADVMISDSMPAAMQMLMSDVLTWLVVYGAAAGGYALLATCRTLTLVGIIVSWDARIENMLKKQEKLVEEWGAGIKQS
jgi:hypothetical protein